MNLSNAIRNRKNKILLIEIAIIMLLILVSEFTTAQLSIENSDILISKLSRLEEKFRKSYAEMYKDFSRRVKFINFISDKTDAFMEIFTKNLIVLILLEPPIDNPLVINLVRYSNSLIAPLYILSILFTGIYLLFISGSPKGRNMAKSSLIKLIFSLGIIMLTIPIIQTLLEISHTVSSLMLSIFKPDVNILKVAVNYFMSFFIFTTFFDFELGIIFFIISISLPFGVLFILSLRYLMIILLTAFFPFAILLYSFIPTQKLGRAILFFTFLWIFLPLVQTAILSVLSLSYKISPIFELNIFISLVGFLLLIFTPIIMAAIANFISSLRSIYWNIKNEGKR